jgi:Polyketide cyclase / dehydrase and lipid transport
VEYTIVEERVARCAPEVVLRRLLDPSTWPQWQPEILAASGPSTLDTGGVARGRARLMGFEVEGHSTAIEVGRDAFEQDVVVGVRMRVRYEITPNPHGVMIVHRLTAELPRGILGRILSFFLRWRLKRMQRVVVARLAAQSESEPSG